MRVLIRALSLFWAVVACAGCDFDDAANGSPPMRASCQMLDASSCQSPIPSYANDVVPLLNRDCNLSTCHGPSADQWPLTDHPSVVAWESLVIHDVENCTMPPPDAGAPALTTAERKTLLDWFACSAPNN